MNLVAWHTARKMSERAALPDLDTLNHEALKALIVAQHAQIPSKDEQLLHREEQLASREEEIERLKLLIAKLRRIQFGRKSEKLDRQIEQLELRLDELEASRAQQGAPAPGPLAASAPKRDAPHRPVGVGAERRGGGRRAARGSCPGPAGCVGRESSGATCAAAVAGPS